MIETQFVLELSLISVVITFLILLRANQNEKDFLASTGLSWKWRAAHVECLHWNHFAWNTNTNHELSLSRDREYSKREYIHGEILSRQQWNECDLCVGAERATLTNWLPLSQSGLLAYWGARTLLPHSYLFRLVSTEIYICLPRCIWKLDRHFVWSCPSSVWGFYEQFRKQRSTYWVHSQAFWMLCWVPPPQPSMPPSTVLWTLHAQPHHSIEECVSEAKTRWKHLLEEVVDLTLSCVELLWTWNPVRELPWCTLAILTTAFLCDTSETEALQVLSWQDVLGDWNQLGPDLKLFGLRFFGM